MRQPISGKVTSTEFTSALSEYLDYCRCKNLSPNTVGYYRDRIGAFFAYCEKQANIVSLDEVSQAILRSYVSHSLDAGYSPRTVNHGITPLKGFFIFLVDEGRMDISPSARLKPVRTKQRILETFTRDQVEAMLTRCDQTTFVGLRNYAMILTFLDTGLRVSELCGLTTAGIDWTERMLCLAGKGGKERLVPFGLTLKSVLRSYVRRRGHMEHEEHLFLTQFAGPLQRRVVLAIVRRIGVAAGVTGVRISPHTFRHTFAKNWILSGGDPFSLQRILGHTTQQMVSQYVNLAVTDLQTQHAKFGLADQLAATPEPKRIVLR